MNRSPAPAVTVTLTEQVSEHLARRISSGEFPAQAKLPPGRVLAAEYGVSAPVVREAIARLQSQGLVEARQGSGVRVRARTPASGFRVPVDLGARAADLAQVFELRVEIESAVAALAAARRTTAQLRTIARRLARLREHLHDEDAGVESDLAFHFAIAEACGNRYFAQLLQYLMLQLRESISVARRNSAARGGVPESVQREHEAIFESIRAGDPARAREASIAHVSDAARRLGLKLPAVLPAGPSRSRS